MRDADMLPRYGRFMAFDEYAFAEDAAGHPGRIVTVWSEYAGIEPKPETDGGYRRESPPADPCPAPEREEQQRRSRRAAPAARRVGVTRPDCVGHAHEFR